MGQARVQHSQHQRRSARRRPPRDQRDVFFGLLAGAVAAIGVVALGQPWKLWQEPVSIPAVVGAAIPGTGQVSGVPEFGSITFLDPALDAAQQSEIGQRAAELQDIINDPFGSYLDHKVAGGGEDAASAQALKNLLAALSDIGRQNP